MGELANMLHDAALKRLKWSVSIKDRVEQGIPVSDGEQVAYDNLDRAIKDMEQTMRDVGIWPSR